MRYLPSYYHLSPQHVKNLVFRVNLRCVRNANVPSDSNPANSKPANVDELDENEREHDHNRIMSKEISWQEKIPRPFDDCVDTGDEEDCIPSGKSGASIELKMRASL